MVNYELISTDDVGAVSVDCAVDSDDTVNSPSSTVGDSANSQIISGIGQKSLTVNNGAHSLDAVLLNVYMFL